MPVGDGYYAQAFTCKLLELCFSLQASTELQICGQLQNSLRFAHQSGEELARTLPVQCGVILSPVVEGDLIYKWRFVLQQRLVEAQLLTQDEHGSLGGVAGHLPLIGTFVA